MLSMHVNVRRLLVGAVVASVSVGGLLFGANAASADSIQVQSYQRSSQSEACTAQAGETAWQASWGSDSSWKPSWEQWANGGNGGWTCARSITWARTPVAGGGGSVSYAVGDIGPGGGLVFLIDNGVHYEMAPANWGAGENGREYCRPGALAGTGTGIGAGKTNTQNMIATCASSPAAIAALAYAGTDNSAGEWFIPSTAELNAMCLYAANPSQPVDTNAQCVGGQDVTFATSAFAFAADSYWTSESPNSTYAYNVNMVSGNRASFYQFSPMKVRPIRSF